MEVPRLGGPIGAIAVGLHHSHSNATSEPESMSYAMSSAAEQREILKEGQCDITKHTRLLHFESGGPGDTLFCRTKVLGL